GLAKNRLSGTIPSTIGNMTALTYLSLAYNQIVGSLPASLSRLTDMQTLRTQLGANMLVWCGIGAVWTRRLCSTT
ncbi:unnamed protein product, partial [Closterium sp. Naga37s-1]